MINAINSINTINQDGGFLMYAKLFDSMFHGSLCTKGPWEALVTFQNMLVLADRFGVVDKTPEIIARYTTIPLDIIQKGIAALEEPDPQSRSSVDGGRRIRLLPGRTWGWEIVNYQYYNSLRSAEDRREYQRNYQREWQKKRKQSVNTINTINQTLTQSTNKTPHTHTHTHTQSEKEKSNKNYSKRKVLPIDFSLTAERQKKAETYWQKKGVSRDVESTFDQFAAHHKSKGTFMLDWDAAWQTWYVNALDMGKDPLQRKNGKRFLSPGEKSLETAMNIISKLERTEGTHEPRIVNP
jgi:hypothetical protein